MFLSSQTNRKETMLLLTVFALAGFTRLAAAQLGGLIRPTAALCPNMQFAQVRD